jgi:serine/threonine-protein kinase
MVGSIQYTNDLDVHMALIQAPSYARVIAEKYRIVGQIGAGGMGSVWRALHLTLGTPVAIKLIDDAIAKHPEIGARFEREARAAATLRSPRAFPCLGADFLGTLRLCVVAAAALRRRGARGMRSPRSAFACAVCSGTRSIASCPESGWPGASCGPICGPFERARRLWPNGC